MFLMGNYRIQLGETILNKIKIRGCATIIRINVLLTPPPQIFLSKMSTILFHNFIVLFHIGISCCSILCIIMFCAVAISNCCVKSFFLSYYMELSVF